MKILNSSVKVLNYTSGNQTGTSAAQNTATTNNLSGFMPPDRNGVGSNQFVDNTATKTDKPWWQGPLGLLAGLLVIAAGGGGIWALRRGDKSEKTSSSSSVSPTSDTKQQLLTLSNEHLAILQALKGKIDSKGFEDDHEFPTFDGSKIKFKDMTDLVDNLLKEDTTKEINEKSLRQILEILISSEFYDEDFKFYEFIERLPANYTSVKYEIERVSQFIEERIQDGYVFTGFSETIDLLGKTKDFIEGAPDLDVLMKSLIDKTLKNPQAVLEAYADPSSFDKSHQPEHYIVASLLDNMKLDNNQHLYILECGQLFNDAKNFLGVDIDPEDIKAVAEKYFGPLPTDGTKINYPWPDAVKLYTSLSDSKFNEYEFHQTATEANEKLNSISKTLVLPNLNPQAAIKLAILTSASCSTIEATPYVFAVSLNKRDSDTVVDHILGEHIAQLIRKEKVGELLKKLPKPIDQDEFLQAFNEGSLPQDILGAMFRQIADGDDNGAAYTFTNRLNGLIRLSS